MKKNNQQIVSSQIAGNILVVLPKFIGDAVNCTPALQLLKDLYPTKSIILFVRPHLAEMFKRETDYCVIVDERFDNNKPISMWAQAKILKNANIELAVIMRNSLSEAILCFLASIKYRVGYAKNGRSPLLTHKLKLDENHHYIFRYCRLVNEPHGNPFSSIPKTAIVKEPSLLIPKQNKKSIGVYFGGKNKGLRHYPNELSFVAMVDIAKNIDCTFYIFGDNGELEDTQQLQERLNQQKIDSVVLAGKTSIITMIDAIGELDLLLTIDSGPMHIAAAFNIPFVAVVGLGTSPWSVVAPKVTNAITLIANGDQLLEKDIINEIKPHHVSEAALKLLDH
ncbi:glycosyltransferase family 9 protein [Pseudoalteromonas sp. SR44-5]|uniref:glycosyltransferase family 9 protein n=1 Tax=Pseudoalteromonas TaxID=53246 RepID=UPI0016040ECD|nr:MULTISPECIES: glycosyltransferase family 9 protein [unclassified Pseudoalteromonas]MBB1331820.1 glycosyltransferase family 9 protein [Pseudoalteromonas sp. SR41-6]MBB1341688.1 glycosyltransferase family 9 protein [Pseudoalteromonas sp. SR45-6]MBB1366941.1 glycosyltransferase family 9 protein [Pseudoalteromonas sp. SR44-5]MBB1417858.1 glycosyltransferase family 9 protein [Pseudoalteromonas sp. SG44-1]MBB1423433.1 glycosyltransferase family 9 protein [Pseudoalteromonas sp. SG43-7]